MEAPMKVKVERTNRHNGDAFLDPHVGRRLSGFSRLAESSALIVIWVLLIIAFTIAEPGRFMTLANWSNILGSQAVLFVLTMAVLLPSILEDLDLSLGAIVGLSAMVVAVLNVQHHVPVLLAALVAVIVAAAVGAVNALFVVKFKDGPLIVTLATMTIVQGIVYAMSNSATIGIVSTNLSDWVFTKTLLGIPLEFYYGLIVFLIVWYFLGMTPLGQRMLVVGQSRDVARLSGIKVGGMRAAAFIIAAAIAGIAGVLYVGTTGAADPTAGSTYLLPAYAAAFLGSTAIRPGRFNAPGSTIAIFFLASGVSGLEILGAQDWVQYLFYGGILLISVTISGTLRK